MSNIDIFSEFWTQRAKEKKKSKGSFFVQSHYSNFINTTTVSFTITVIRMQPQSKSPKRDCKIAKQEKYTILTTRVSRVSMRVSENLSKTDENCLPRVLLPFLIFVFFFLPDLVYSVCVSTICLHLVLNRVW